VGGSVGSIIIIVLSFILHLRDLPQRSTARADQLRRDIRKPVGLRNCRICAKTATTDHAPRTPRPHPTISRPHVGWPLRAYLPRDTILSRWLTRLQAYGGLLIAQGFSIRAARAREVRPFNLGYLSSDLSSADPFPGQGEGIAG
jgi:hypothetical protein